MSELSPQKLTDTPMGARARVLEFVERTPYSAQLERLGLVAGTEFQVVRRAPLGDPIEIRLRGYSLAIRPHEAGALSVQIIE